MAKAAIEYALIQDNFGSVPFAVEITTARTEAWSGRYLDSSTRCRGFASTIIARSPNKETIVKAKEAWKAAFAASVPDIDAARKALAAARNAADDACKAAVAAVVAAADGDKASTS